MSKEIETYDLDNDRLQFLSHKSSYSNCYVCLNETNYLSPCECKTSICNICFKDILTNNGKKCTICKEDFDSIILEKIKIVIPNLEIEENSEESSEENSEDSVEENQFNEVRRNSNIICFKAVLFIFSIPFFGMIINDLNRIKQPFLFTLQNILMGLFVWLFIGILYSICSLIIFIFSNIRDMFGFYYRYFLLR